ncbi:hypothetical protein LJC07_08540 [Christensenellaceae bacterium OttesenSCG-928-L17]|nr:hypothetical protein [Christensenellaceae bacterium OttesenSCG-928-L17]
MKLPMFDVMDATAALLEKRRDFYQQCGYELQELLATTLASDMLLNVNVRVKREASLREKILRKRLYLLYDNAYDLLNALSDLIGLRAECRFLTEEPVLYERLLIACTLAHDDGTKSVPSHPNIRFDLSTAQPQRQVNGLTIYRIDGKYHKNGVSAPFELQIKSLVHVFWAEIEHQLIYKNNTYVMMDSFLKDLLYSNYDSLQQIDSHLHMIYDQMQRQTLPRQQDATQYANVRPVLAKTMSDIFLNHMRDAVGFSLRMDHICDIVTGYLIVKLSHSGDPLNLLFDRVRRIVQFDPVFDEMIELNGAYDSDDPFCRSLSCHITQRLNLDYEWHLLFRLLMVLEEGEPLPVLHGFLSLYSERFDFLELYADLPEEEAAACRDTLRNALADSLVQNGGVMILHEDTIAAMNACAQQIAADGCVEYSEIKQRFDTALEQ